MEKFKPVNLVNYNNELSVHIYVNYLRGYIASLKEDKDILFASNILIFYFNAMNFRDDFASYISYEDLEEYEFYKTYDDGHTILTLLLKWLNHTKGEKSDDLVALINEFSYVIGYSFTKEDVQEYLISLMNYIAKVNQIECDFKDYVFDDELTLQRKIEYFSPSYKI